ncbi:hypothetical protein PhCBS80983_g02013 [Powellomyces hirtus]|uniref:non-specific serine/threonine protein kinase n=1 Tax=Powellomyces hirtus TaxID=109895 RepID=A0A507E9N6_9FUNG|nr:hypothetical protein PhCBS80983_g02013 [Powellomyces hirtus]
MENYKILRTIGIGSSGCVRLAECKQPPNKKNEIQLVCVKEVSLGNMSKEERRSAVREAKVLKHLPPHPNIVGYRSALIENGSLYIVLEYAESGDLDAYLARRNGALVPEAQIWKWTLHLLLGIHHLHTHKILHRDIKTKNIFLTRTNTLQLGDFGIARSLATTLDSAHTAIGTPFYLSPEICEGRAYSWKSDVWSLGCVIYELATLHHAFYAANLSDLIQTIIRGRYPSISSTYTRELRGMIGSMLQTRAELRPSVEELMGVGGVKRAFGEMLRSSGDGVAGYGGGGEGLPRTFRERVYEKQRLSLLEQQVVRQEQVMRQGQENPMPLKGARQRLSERVARVQQRELAVRTAVPSRQDPDAEFQRKSNEKLEVMRVISSKDSIFTRIEFARMFIEQELGLQTFLTLYARARATPPADDTSCWRAMRMVRQLGEVQLLQ